MRGALLWLSVLVLVGCQAFEDFKVVPHSITTGDMSSSPPDLTPLAAPCKAAQGLSGTPLVCVDFDQVTDLMNDPKVRDWNFTAIIAGNCPGWQSNGGVLQIKNFGSFGGAGNNICGFTLPQTMQAQIGQYQRLTLSVQQHIDLLDPAHQAQIFLNSSTPANRVMWQGTGTRAVARQQTTITVDTTELPDPNGFYWLFQISSQQALALKGWQFDSIAVLGHP